MAFMTPGLRKSLLTIAAIIFISSVLAACGGVSIQGGVIGGALSGLIAIVLLIGTAGTQTGCDTTTGPCLSFIPAPGDAGDAGAEDAVGPCLSPPPPDAEIDAGVEVDAGQDMDAGQDVDAGHEDAEPADVDVMPCLSPPPPDAEPEDAELMPCLSPLPPDAAPEDGAVGPCLSMAPPDVGPCLSIDGGSVPDTGATDVSMAPSVPKLDQVADPRHEVIAKLADRGVIPADVLARLTGKEDA